ncbi:hypothetical protein AMELA_G00246360 [Ameiurus melas]|uniref:Uncharacterized protein n=1 Tax=Ameiurus melas TaxID=219545 RepID=A0A7J5ZWT0_AMEME|nr:hypothetical protein AMELA_G00246360 [Ameiurus melas]
MDSGKLFCGVTNRNLKLFWETPDARPLQRTKEERDCPAFNQRSVQKPVSLTVWGCISAYGTGSLHIWKGTINAERECGNVEK